MCSHHPTETQRDEPTHLDANQEQAQNAKKMDERENQPGASCMCSISFRGYHCSKKSILPPSACNDSTRAARTPVGAPCKQRVTNGRLLLRCRGLLKHLNGRNSQYSSSPSSCTPRVPAARDLRKEEDRRESEWREARVRLFGRGRAALAASVAKTTVWGGNRGGWLVSGGRG